MKNIEVCSICGKADIIYHEKDMCYCSRCKKYTWTRSKTIYSPYERTRRAVYATGNKWAIENFNATH